MTTRRTPTPTPTPTPEMVEHAARAIHDAGYCLSGSWRPWEEWHSPSYREIVRDQARAAIKAMLEPTATMLEAALSETPIPEGWPTGTGAQLVGSISSARGYAHSRAKTSLGSRSMTALSETPETGER